MVAPNALPRSLVSTIGFTETPPSENEATNPNEQGGINEWNDDATAVAFSKRTEW